MLYLFSTNLIEKHMKKILSMMAVIACLFMAIPAQAQFQFGVKGGLNVSKVSVSKEVFSPDNKSGFFFGPTAEFTLPLLGIGMDVSALYNQYGIDTEEGSTMKKSIEIPINLKWTVGFSSVLGAYLAVGPQFGFNVGSRFFRDVMEFNKKSTSLNVGAGLKILGHVHVGANYNIGLKDTGVMWKDDNGNETIVGFDNHTWQVSVAYMF